MGICLLVLCEGSHETFRRYLLGLENRRLSRKKPRTSRIIDDDAHFIFILETFIE